MSWLYQGQVYDGQDADQWVGFVYLIVNKLDGRRYFGKKLLWFAKSKTVKGKKKRFKVESDWRDYWSSSEELKSDVEKLGTDNFTREILYFCKSKGTLSYLEAREQFDHRVLEEQDKFYNKAIQIRVHQKHLKF
jgi:hypothetical protein